MIKNLPKRICYTAVLALGCFSSNENKTDFERIKILAPEWRDYLEWTENSRSSTSLIEDSFYYKDGYFLYLKNRNPKDFKTINSNNLVMVSASKYTVLGKQIQNHPKAIAVFDSKQYFVQVLVDVSNPLDRDELAIASHEDIGACGGMVPLSLTASLFDALPSYLNPRIKIAALDSIFGKVSSDRIKASVAELVALGSRFHSGAYSSAAVAKTKSMLQNVLPSSSTIEEVSNGSSSSQNSLVVKIPGTVDTTTTVVLGAHLDSINKSDETNAPGADDNATGISTLVEVLRVIKDQNLTFARNLEIHAYAAEEVGLVGSSTIATNYKNSGKKIAGQLQLDMNGYSDASSAGNLYLVSTDTSDVLRLQIKELMGTYSLGKWVEAPLKAGTSDHKSWMNAGYHAVFPFENPTGHNPYIHSAKDQSSVLDFSMSAQFAKVTLAWASYNAGVNGYASEYDSKNQALGLKSTEMMLGIVPGKLTGNRLLVTAEVSAATVVSCIVSIATDTTCAKNVTSYRLSKTQNSRTFFETLEDLTLTDGELHRFVAYDSFGVALLQRTVRVSQTLPLGSAHSFINSLED